MIPMCQLNPVILKMSTLDVLLRPPPATRWLNSCSILFWLVDPWLLFPNLKPNWSKFCLITWQKGGRTMWSLDAIWRHSGPDTRKVHRSTRSTNPDEANRGLHQFGQLLVPPLWWPGDGIFWLKCGWTSKHQWGLNNNFKIESKHPVDLTTKRHSKIFKIGPTTSQVPRLFREALSPWTAV